MIEENKLSKAVETLVHALKNDPEYRRAWQANIAMSFKEQFDDPTKVHKQANKSANTFLSIFCRTSFEVSDD